MVYNGCGLEWVWHRDLDKKGYYFTTDFSLFLKRVGSKECSQLFDTSTKISPLRSLHCVQTYFHYASN